MSFARKSRMERTACGPWTASGALITRMKSSASVGVFARADHQTMDEAAA